MTASPSAKLSLNNFVADGVLDEAVAAFLRAAIAARKNIVISGRMGCGKSALLTALADEIDLPERLTKFDEIREAADIGPLLQAMAGSASSVSTIHARSAADAIERILDLSLVADGGASAEDNYRKIARAVDLVVHLSRSRGRLLVSEVAEVTGVGDDGRPTLTEVFGTISFTRWAIVPVGRPVDLDGYAQVGFDPSLLDPRGPRGVVR